MKMKRSQFPHAFTMAEVLIVVAIIVLVLTLAVPALNFIGGSKSVEGATNNISAMLARARNEAIGLQQVAGLFFYNDPNTGLVTMAIVKDVGSSVSATGPVVPQVYLDLADSDVQTLPSGVSAQMIDDVAYTAGGARTDDAYIGYNTVLHDAITNGPPTITMNSGFAYGGVILFDGNGQLVSKIYAFQISTGTVAGTFAWTNMGRLFLPSTYLINNLTPTVSEQDWVPGAAAAASNAGIPERSQFGLVLFDHAAFLNAGGGDDDPQVISGSNGSYSGSTDATTEETWLDQNATLLLINRYNGTLVKGE
jgi:prepilin-type N-terminal cleavage/methylation domain-containing protein